MFIIHPDNPNDWAEALLMLSYYHVSGVMYSNGENVEGMHMAVGAHNQHPDNKDTDDDDVALAEMCFQMNWIQRGKVCCACRETDGAEVCGHLEFTRPINDDAFNKLISM